MNDVYICYVLARSDQRENFRTVFTFIAGADPGEANHLAGAAADAWTDATGQTVNWFVEPLPYAGAANEWELLRLVREAAADA
jgi:hypothetical protein